MTRNDSRAFTIQTSVSRWKFDPLELTRHRGLREEESSRCTPLSKIRSHLQCQGALELCIAWAGSTQLGTQVEWLVRGPTPKTTTSLPRLETLFAKTLRTRWMVHSKMIASCQLRKTRTTSSSISMWGKTGALISLKRAKRRVTNLNLLTWRRFNYSIPLD